MLTGRDLTPADTRHVLHGRLGSTLFHTQMWTMALASGPGAVFIPGSSQHSICRKVDTTIEPKQWHTRCDTSGWSVGREGREREGGVRERDRVRGRERKGGRGGLREGRGSE